MIFYGKTWQLTEHLSNMGGRIKNIMKQKYVLNKSTGSGLGIDPMSLKFSHEFRMTTLRLNCQSEYWNMF